MSQEQVNTKAVDLVGHGTANDEFKDRRQIGNLVIGVRIDDLPEDETARLAAEGYFSPLTIDPNGNLRVALPPSGTKVETQELEVLIRIEQLLIEQRNLLLKIASA